jgi:hypothetical protein
MISLSAPWAPDQYDRNASKLVSEASGVLPGPSSYVPWPGMEPFSVALPTGACRGAFAARTTAGNYRIFAGTATRLYAYIDAVTAWTDVTRLVGGDYAVPDDEQWAFAQFGDQLIVVNATDDPQVINITAGSNFAALGGSPPKARYVKTVGDQLWLGGLSANPNRVYWSGRNNAEFWTVGQQDCDYQDFPEGGFVTGLTALEAGLVFQEGAVRRFGATQDRAIYQFAKVEESRGLLAPASLVSVGSVSFYYSEDGFYATDGSGASASIGADIVDKWFKDQVNNDRINMIVGAPDPVRQRIFWLFPTIGNSTPYLDHLLCYDYALKQCTHAAVTSSYLFPSATAGYTLEGLDALGTLDALPFSLDSRFLQGGAPYLAGFDIDDMMSFFSGPSLAARVESAGFQLIPGKRAFVQGCHPYTDATAATVTVGTSERPQAVYGYGSASAINAQGFVPLRSSGRLHRFRMDIAAAATWTHLQGLDPVYEQDGER